MIQWILHWWWYGNNKYNNNNDHDDDTRVIIVLNTDQVRTVQGVDTLDELKQLTLNAEEQAQELDPQKDTPGRIALRLKQFRDSRVAVLGHTNHNLLSFLVNILLSHKVKSLIMLKKTREDLSLLDPEKLNVEDRMQLETRKQIIRDEQIASQRDPDSQDIFVYEPSRAERTFLEERF
jgi:hypothetical protein